MDPSSATDSGPLSYRHDGSSPLPLGLEWSPGPVHVGGTGEDSVWPGVPADAWCFTVTVPAWVTVTPDLNHSAPGAAAAAAAMGPIDPFTRASPIVLYRLAVAVRSPAGATTTTRLLRRFSDFLSLHRALVNLFPAPRRIPDPPPRHRLLFVSSSPALASQRRTALQAWLSLLLEDLEVSRSPPLAAFLDLPEAARLAALALEAQSQEPAQERYPRDSDGHTLGNTLDYTRNSDSHSNRGSNSNSNGHSTRRGEGVPVVEPLRALPGGAGDGAQLSSELLEAYLSQRKGVGIGVPADCQSTAGDSSGLPSPSPPSSFHRVLSASSLASLTLPPGAEAHTEAAVDQEGEGLQPALGSPGAEARAGLGVGAGAGAGAGSGVGVGVERNGKGSSLGSAGPTFGVTGTPASDPLSSHAANAPPPLLPPQQPLRGVHVSSQQGGGGEEPLLVVREEARPLARRQLAALQRRLQVAQADMAALVERLQQEAAVSDFLTQKVKDVEAELDSERRGSGAAVAQAVAQREERLVAVEWELEEERGRLADALAAVERHQEREQGLEATLEAMAQRLQEAEGTMVQQRARDEAQQGPQEGESQAGDREALMREAREEGRAEGREEGERRAREEGERAKGEVQALATEVKSLRMALEAAQGEAARQRQQAEAYRKLLEAEQKASREHRRRKERTVHEIEVLAQRLRETAVTALGSEAAVISAAGSTAGTPTAGMPTAGTQAGGGAGKDSVGDEVALLAENLELLATSDARVELILAEALLLKELPELSPSGSTCKEATGLEASFQQGDSAANGHGDGGPQSAAASLPNGGVKDVEGELSAVHSTSGLASGDGVPSGDGVLSGDGVYTSDGVLSAEESVAQVKQMRREEESCDRELLFSAVGLLVEMAQQRRSINALLRHAYASKMP